MEGSRRWPDEKECLALLRKAGCSGRVIEHLKLVEKIAVAIARRIVAQSKDPAPNDDGKAMCRVDVDIDLVRAGALLHDIGRGRTHGIRHAVTGAELARDMGLPEELALIIERHIGAGIESEEAKRLGLPPKEYLPLTTEEKIVAHADNLAGPHGKVKLAEVLHDLERKGAAHVVPRMEALHRGLSRLCGIDIDDIVVVQERPPKTILSADAA